MNGNTPFNPHIHHRHTIRLAGYDYSRAGAYFLTLCAHHHKNIFGTIVDDRIELNACGRIVHNEWLKSAKIRWEIELDEFIIMPDHLHGIVIIHDIDRRGDRPVAPTVVKPGPRSKTIGAMIAGFKSAVTTQINQIRKTPMCPVWQRNYYEHVIRDEKDLSYIREYVVNNPKYWAYDEYYT